MPGLISYLIRGGSTLPVPRSEPGEQHHDAGSFASLSHCLYGGLPEHLSKTSTGFRLLLVLPILAIAALIGGYTDSLDFLFRWQLAAGGYLTLPTALMILFRMKYPRWWFDWNLQLVKLSSRVGIYLCLATDKYPAIDEEQSVHVAADYPDVSRDLNRWLPLVKWFLAIPH